MYARTFFFFKGFISSLEVALSSESWLSECPGGFMFRVTLDLGETLSPRMDPEVRLVIKMGGGFRVELIWAGLLPGQPCSHPRSVNEPGTGEPHTFQPAFSSAASRSLRRAINGRCRLCAN